jgi:hypothetical protein
MTAASVLAALNTMKNACKGLDAPDGSTGWQSAP